MRGAAVVCAVLIVAGCSSSGSQGASSAPTVSATPTAFTSYASTDAARTDMCAIFDRFYADILRLTPRDSQVQLVQDFGDAHHGIIQAAIATDNGTFLNDATNLVGYVGSSAFPTTGNLLGAPVMKMQADCGES